MRTLNRYFRENSRVLLIVFMTLLVVVFLIGDVLQWMGRGSSTFNEKIGTAFGRTLYTGELVSTDTKIRLLDALGLPYPVQAPDQERSLAVHLLIEEAKRMGVSVGRQQVIDHLSRVGMPPAAIDNVSRNFRMSLEQIYSTIGERLAVQILADLQSDGLVASESRMRMTYRDEAQEAEVRLSVIDANALLPWIPEPDAESLAKHFEEGKDRSDAHTDTALKFGYRIPDRVQIEYLSVDPEAIKPDIAVTNSEVKSYFEKNAARYTKPGPTPATTPTQPVAQPEMIPMTFEEARARAEEDCRAAKAIEEAQRLMAEVQRAAYSAWQNQGIGEDGFRPAPAADRLVAFTDLRDRFSKQYPVVYGKTELVTNAELSADRSGVAASFIMRNQQRIRAGDLAFRVKGLYTPTKQETLPTLNLMEPTPVLSQQTFDPVTRAPVPGRPYIFRVIAVAPAAPPPSVDAVRDRAVSDLKMVNAFAEAEKYARTIADRAREVGLDAAVAEATALRERLGALVASQPATDAITQQRREKYLADLGPFSPNGPFLRRPGRAPNVPRSQALHNEIFALVDAPFSATMPVHRIVIVPYVPERKWIVAELIAPKPLYEGEFAARLPSYEQRSADAVRRNFTSIWFSPAGIYQRAGYVPDRPAPPVE